jgi:hypothetical protein
VMYGKIKEWIKGAGELLAQYADHSYMPLTSLGLHSLKQSKVYKKKVCYIAPLTCARHMLLRSKWCSTD